MFEKFKGKTKTLFHLKQTAFQMSAEDVLKDMIY